MIEIPLAAIPNQTLSIRLNNSFYNVALKFVSTVMAVDVTRDNMLLVQGQRVVSGFPIIPYEYLWEDSGNFAIITRAGDYPIYTEFGISQYLLFATTAEIEALNG